MGVLDEIIAAVRVDLAERERTVRLSDLRARIDAIPPARPVLDEFRSPGVSVIAEVKRASPSKGVLAAIERPADLAAEYEAGGASAISVLTERHRFNGSLDDLDAVRERVDVAILRKDFMVTEYQLVESRAHGADLCLLIVAALNDTVLRTLHRTALDLGLTPLVEVHTVEETLRAIDLGAELIGVNNRNLQTLEVSIDQFGELAQLIPDTTVKVAESGLGGPEDVALVHGQGANVVLVGEALVRHGDPRSAVGALRAAAASHAQAS